MSTLEILTGSVKYFIPELFFAFRGSNNVIVLSPKIFNFSTFRLKEMWIFKSAKFNAFYYLI
ncbi:MAG: hypothetical protein D6748_09820 [Calditrichaeota bacterium]|nr:MAG: hypothetical protein D6748_09820 [Calditrichota bacterium]